MIVADPWTQMLEQLEPEYLTLKFIVEVGPKVKAILRKINFSWRVRIEEDWDNTASEDQHLYYKLDYTNLDIRCEWADHQLATWETAIRLGHQEWKFSKQKDAEKFITLFNLRWTR